MEHHHIKNSSTLLVAAGMLFTATSSALPYAYYQILRWVVTIISVYFGYSIYRSSFRGSLLITLLLGITAIFFNPIAPIYLRKEQWSPINAIAGVFLLVVFVIVLLQRRRREE